MGSPGIVTLYGEDNLSVVLPNIKEMIILVRERKTEEREKLRGGKKG